MNTPGRIRSLYLRWPRIVASSAVGALCVLGSCSESAVNPIAVASIELTPSATSVRAGSSTTLVARPLDASGRTVDVGAISWSSSDKSLATVSSTGVVTALAAGNVRIAASALGKSGTANVTVTARVVASVVVTPPAVTMRVGVSVPLSAQTLDADGGALSGRLITWTSSNTAVATVNAQGSVTGVAPGAATVTAASEGRTGQAAVTVTIPPVQTVVVAPAADTVAVGGERPHTATLRDAGGALLTGRTIAWSSSNVAVATVTSTGTVTGRAPGNATIAATSEGRVGTAAVIVIARPADAVLLTPASTTLIVNATQQMTTQVTDPIGNILTGRPVTYSSDAPAIATVNATGLVTAIAPGTARISATSDGKVGTATITVIPEPVASVQVTPATATLITGDTQQLTTTARSAAGVLLTGRPMTWTSGAPGVATVSSSGLVTAVSPGVVVILTSVEGVTATSTITVNAPTVASVTISQSAPSILVGGSVQLSVTARDAAGATINGRPVVWTSADESIAFVSSTGLVVGFKVGTVRITATVEGVSASALVTVR